LPAHSFPDGTLHRKKQMTDISISTLAPPQTVAMKGKMSARETMSAKNPSPEMELPEFAYGSVWLVGAGDGDPRHLSPLAVHALGTADAVIHDLAVPRELLDLVKPSHYREAGSPYWAIGRAIHLAQDGWRVVHLVEGDTMEHAVEIAMRCNERNVPCRIVPNASEPIGAEALPGLLLVRKRLSVGGADPRLSLVLVVPNPHSDAAAGIVPRQRPLDFSMSGLAG
jgi:hypothetical protein